MNLFNIIMNLNNYRQIVNFVLLSTNFSKSFKYLFKDAKNAQILLLEKAKLNGVHTKYPAINLYIGICNFIAIANLAISFLVFIASLPISSKENNPTALGFGLAVLLFGTISCISILAFSQLLKLLVDIESNQRKIIDKLK